MASEPKTSSQPASETSKPGRNRRSLIFVLAALLLFGLLATAYWHWASGQILAGLERWRQDQMARGFTVEFGQLEVTGYPFALELGIPAPAIVAPDGRYWRGPPLRGEAALWNPFTIDATLSGEHLFGGLKAVGEITAAAPHATLQIQMKFNAAPDYAVVSANSVRIQHQDQQLLSIGELEAVLGPLRPAENDRLQELDFDFAAKQVTLPNDGGTPLGRVIEALALKTTLRGPLPATDLRQALPIWRDAGGEAIVHSADIAWGPVTLHAEGAAKLDALFRPQGAFGTKVSGLTEVLDALVKRGQIKPAQAGILSFALLSLGGGNGRQVALPITMKDGLLSAGPVPIAPLKPLL